MKIVLGQSDAEELEVEDFVKIKSKRPKLTGRQTVRQLVSAEPGEPDPNTRFTNADLNLLARLGFLEELVTAIRVGKEASVFLGRSPEGFVAVKLYTDLRVRSFRRDETYREGRYIADKRIERAIAQGSQNGLEARQAMWVQEEFRQMQHLERHGVNVPEAIAVNGLALIMEFIGDEDGIPAARISDLKLEKQEAQEAFRQAVENLKLIVRSGRVHGDYSAFNILWNQGEAVVIDFPQVIEIEHSPNAHGLLERDVRSLCKSFEKQGLQPDERQVLREVRAAMRMSQ